MYSNNKEKTSEILWNYLVELRKELVQSQKIRTQIIGFKITFVTAAIGFLATKLTSTDGANLSLSLSDYGNLLFIIPAISAIFFDFLINSYSFSIKRIGLYIRHEIEPNLLIDDNIILWEQFLNKYSATKQKLAMIGNLGLTFLSVLIASISLCFPYYSHISPALILCIIILFVLNTLNYRAPKKLDKIHLGNKTSANKANSADAKSRAAD